MTEEEFLNQFENLSLSPDDFNHRGHLWLGWLYVRDYELGEASKKLTQGIRDFANSLGAANKFHFTLTTTFACAIKSRFKEGQSFEEFLLENEDLKTNPISLVETHYSQELLRSSEAREKLVPPNREPFPLEYKLQLDNF